VIQLIAGSQHLDGPFSGAQVHFGQPNPTADLMQLTMQYKIENQFQNIDINQYLSIHFATG
jgi:hypothetical protein